MYGKAKRDANQLFRWAIMKLFDSNPGLTVNCNELKHEVEEAWNDLVADGEVILREEENKN